MECWQVEREEAGILARAAVKHSASSMQCALVIFFLKIMLYKPHNRVACNYFVSIFSCIGKKIIEGKKRVINVRHIFFVQ